jgi:YfiH family protein
MNLGAHCGDDPVSVQQNRELLAALLPADPLWLRQVHGATAVQHESSVAEEPEADGVVAFGVNQVCAVLTADCLPVLFSNRNGTKVAAAHAGWRGLARGILEATLNAMGEPPDRSQPAPAAAERTSSTLRDCSGESRFVDSSEGPVS